MTKISDIEGRQALIFQQIANHVAKCNGLPAIAWNWGPVAAEVELAVEGLLHGRRNPAEPDSAEVACLVDVWRMLEAERLALRDTGDWKLAA